MEEENYIEQRPYALLNCNLVEPKTGGKYQYSKELPLDFSKIEGLYDLCRFLSREAIKELSCLNCGSNFISGEIYYKEAYSSPVFLKITRDDEWHIYRDRKIECTERHNFYPEESVELIKKNG